MVERGVDIPDSTGGGRAERELVSIAWPLEDELVCDGLSASSFEANCTGSARVVYQFVESGGAADGLVGAG